MQRLQTPDEAFSELPDFPYQPRYVQVPDGEGGSLRVAAIDEGSPDGIPVLLMHGEPSWSYLYRHMIPPLVDAGCRVVAPDLVGFGRSDKPVSINDHAYARHVAWMSATVFERMDLKDIVLFCQDWGGLIGLRLVAEAPERFAGVIAANTGLPTGDQRLPDAFQAWQRYARDTETFPIGMIVQGGTTTELPPETVAAYDAPFPDESYKAGPRAMPSLVPTQPDDPASADNRRAWDVLAGFKRPTLTAFSDHDPVTAGGHRVFHKLVPGAEDQPHTTIAGAGHFLQEDAPDRLAAVIIDMVERVVA